MCLLSPIQPDPLKITSIWLFWKQQLHEAVALGVTRTLQAAIGTYSGGTGTTAADKTDKLIEVDELAVEVWWLSLSQVWRYQLQWD